MELKDYNKYFGCRIVPKTIASDFVIAGVIIEDDKIKARVRIKNYPDLVNIAFDEFLFLDKIN